MIFWVLGKNKVLELFYKNKSDGVFFFLSVGILYDIMNDCIFLMFFG